jgi:hypothetical protein
MLPISLGQQKATGARYYSGFAIGMRELGYAEGRDYDCRRWWKSWSG